jgi:hypothetical protein
MQVTRLSQTHETEFGTLWKFRREAEDDLSRMKANVIELQESANVTSRHIEDIYDKDVIALQDFRTVAENEMKRIRDDIDAMALMQEAAERESDAAPEDAAALPVKVRFMTQEEIG